MQQPPPNYLPSAVPELKTRGITIDIEPGEMVPVPGNFIVSIGKGRKPGSVYQIIERRSVKSIKYPGRWGYRVVRCPELLKDVHVSFRLVVTIKGQTEPAFPVIWYARGKKKNNA